MPRLVSVKIEGFKSIRSAKLDFHNLNILIGANGAGKSNLLSFFTMARYLAAGEIRTFVGEQGGSNSLLWNGSKATSQISAELTVDTGLNLLTLTLALIPAAPDTLFPAVERLELAGSPVPSNGERFGGHMEDVRRLLDQCQAFQFHDTSSEAKIRKEGYIHENDRLRRYGGNLAAFLYRLQQTNRPFYRRIVATIQQVTPFFEDFELVPSALNPNTILLNWRERGSEYLLGPHQLSDGTLRAMALIALLLQPEDELPDVILLDEPELGLHPAALQLLASLLRSVSHHSQVIVATQSLTLLNHFQPEDIVVVEREDGGTVFHRHTSDRLREWLDEYTLGELWEKNVIGGRPAR